MATYFLDTSTIVKRYIQEVGTTWVQAIAEPAAGHLPAVVRITLAETVAAVARKERGGLLTPQAATTALDDFRVDFTKQYVVVDVSTGLVDHAARLAQKHALRGYDAVQLAAALEVRAYIPSLTFVSADANLNTAAIAALLSADDPNRHP